MSLKYNSQVNYDTFVMDAHAREKVASILPWVEDDTRTPAGFWGGALLVASIMIFSANSATYQLLLRHDSLHVINSCSVNCGSQLIGLLTLPIIFRRDLNMRNLRALTRKQVVALCISTLLYAGIGPFFLLVALSSVSIPTVAILQRLESVEFLILSIIFLRVSVDGTDLTNAILTLSGIALTLLSPPMFGEEIDFSIGSLQVIIAGLCFSSSLILVKKYLTTIPVGLLASLRVLGGTILYHLLILIMSTLAYDDKLQAHNYFQVYLSWDLWKQLWWYGLVFVTLANVCWLKALSTCSPMVITIGSTLLFPCALAWGIVLLSAWPTNSQWLGSGVLLFSVTRQIKHTMSGS